MDWKEEIYNINENEKSAISDFLNAADIELAGLMHDYPNHTMPNHVGSVDYVNVTLVGRKGTTGEDYKARYAKQVKSKTLPDRDVVGAIVKIGWFGNPGHATEDVFFLNDAAAKRYLVDALDNPKETFYNCLRMLDGLSPYPPDKDVVLVGRRMS